MEVDSRVGQTGPRNARAKVNVVSRMEEILYTSSEMGVFLCNSTRGEGIGRGIGIRIRGGVPDPS